MKQHCPMHCSHFGMPRQPQEVEKEEWTVWWEDEGSQSVWTFGTKTADSISMPICLVSALNQTWPSQADDSRGLRPGEAFSPKPDTRKLRCVLAQRTRACMVKQSHRRKREYLHTGMCTQAKAETTGKESVLIYCKEAIQRIEMRPGRLWRANPHSRWLCFFISPLMRAHFLRSVQHSRCFSPFAFVSIKGQQNPIQKNK